MTTWVLVANASEAYLYTTENIRTKSLSLEKEFAHPESRNKGIDLISDRPGHYQTDHMTRSAYEKSDPKAVEADNFALELAHVLKDGFGTNAFKDVIIVAAPHFFGLINKHLDLTKVNGQNIAKDYTKLTIKELSETVRKCVFG